MTGGFSLGGTECVFSDAQLLLAAHELKSPLSLIRQLSLGIESGDINQKQIAEYARQITLTTERSLRLTNDLTRSVKSLQNEFELEPVNVKLIVEDVAHELEPLYKAKNKKLELNHGKNRLALANRDLLRRILVNFTDNALNYSLSSQNVVLKTQVIGDDRIRCGVRDYGPPLKTTEWLRIKDGLSQGLAGLSNRPQSSGLGLYIAEQFAQAMSTHICTIKHKNGVTFYLDLKQSNQLSLL